MPKQTMHEMISKVRTGYNFRDLHSWIDKYHKTYGFNHRTKRHAYNEKEENKIITYWERRKGKEWGNKAVVEWLFHIAVDNLETSRIIGNRFYKQNPNFFKFGWKKDHYLLFDHDKLKDEKLQNHFKNYKYKLCLISPTNKWYSKLLHKILRPFFPTKEEMIKNKYKK